MRKPSARGVFDALRAVMIAAIAVAGFAGPTGYTSAQAAIFLRGSGSTPPALFLDTIAPSATAPKFKDSAGVAFSGGNPWKEIGTWTAAPAVVSGTVGSPINLSAFVGLKNSDDQGTQFDLSAELYKNGSLIGSGQTRCVTGVTRNPDQAKKIDVSVSFDPFSQHTFGADDVLSVKISTRIGTTATGTFCGGHANATGLRLYFDGVSRASQLTWPAASQLAAPTLIRAVATGGTGVYVIGRIDGAAGVQSTLKVYVAPNCTNSRLPDGSADVPYPVYVTPDTYGNFGTQLPSGVTPGNFVAFQVTAPNQSPMSACLASVGDNETWPKALQLSGPLTANDYIDAPGKVRWYKFDVLPGQRITVSLSNLPADYDLALFKDIGATFAKLLDGAGDKDALTRASAEFAPTVYAPGAFAPGAFAPGAFAPGAFAPGAFAPGAFAPGAFAPGAFAPGAFAPGAFAPGAFAPGAFAPGAFAPEGVLLDDLSKAFSSAQTRSIIGVSATAGVGNELVVANSWNNTGSFYVRVIGRGGAYSDKQFQVDVTRGATDCTNVVDPKVAYPTLPNITGLDWRPRDPVTGAGLKTLILTDSSKVALGATLADGRTLLDKLLGNQSVTPPVIGLATRPEVVGTLVDVASDLRVKWLKDNVATPNPLCPYATNLVAEEIKGIVDSYRANNPDLRYVVIAGNDDAIPFFRYPDQSLLGEETGYVPPVNPNSASEGSLRRNYVLSQDAYGSGTRISLRASDYPVPGLAVGPVPGLAVGRLVETPDEIAGMIDAYVATNGVVVPRSSFITGYDFLADTANAVKDELACGTAFSTSLACLTLPAGVPQAAQEWLITANTVSPADPKQYVDGGPWRATDLRAALLGTPAQAAPKHDVIFLAGHFSANSALAADFSTNLLTTDLRDSTTDFRNSIVFSAGCHSGYNIVDSAAVDGVTEPFDWVQAFAGKQATLIAGTGYQYGDTDFIEYSERLYLNFARQLRAAVSDGTGVVRIGEALVKAKLDYLASTPDIRGIHEKALLEATLFGLPMLGVNMPGARSTTAGPDSVIGPTSLSDSTALGLKYANLSVSGTLTPQDVPLTSVVDSAGLTASYLPGPDGGVVSNPIEPTLPLVVRNVTPPDPNLVLRGVGFRGGAYSDSTVIPLTGAATTELRGVHVPFTSPLFYPMRPWSINYWGALAGTGATSLLVTPAQHRAFDIAQAQSTRRAYSNLDLRLYYSDKLGKTALSDAPSIISANALQSGSVVEFTVQIVGDPNAEIYEAWITWTSGTGSWDSTGLNLVQCGTPAGAALCGTTQDSSIWKASKDFAPGTVPADLQYVVQAASGYGLVTFDDNRGSYYRLDGAGQAAATLTFDGTPPSTNKFGDDVAVKVKLLSSATNTPLANRTVTVTIGGAASSQATDANGRATITLPLVTVPGTYSLGASFAGDSAYIASATSSSFQVDPATTTLTMTPAPPDFLAVGALLKVTLGNKAYPLLHESVKLTLSGSVTKDIYVITDHLGQAVLPPTGLPVGSYTVAASFAGNATYAAATATLPALTIVPQIISFNGNAMLPSPITIGGAPVTFTVSSSASQPVTVTLAPPTPPPGPYCTLTTADNIHYTLTAVAPGICTITASANGTTTSASVLVTQNITVAKNPQTITFDPLPDKTYGDAAFAVSATASSGLPVAFAASGAACTVAGSTVTIVAADSCTITASQAGNAIYDVATSVPRTLTVNQAAQVVTFGTVGAKTFGDPAFTVSATGGGSGNPVTFSSSGACTIGSASGIVTITSVGLCTLTADQAGNSNYAAGQAQLSFSVGKASQTITFAGPGNQTLGVPANNQVILTATATSGLPVSFAVTPAGVCTVSGATLTMIAAGSCTITASQAGDGNFVAATPVARTITISSGNLPNVWTKVTAPMTKKRFQHTATRFESGPLAGQVLIAGGFDRTGTAQLTAELYNPATRTFVATTGSMPTKSAGHTATLLLDGKVVVFGGGNAKVQRFDPTTKTWSQLSTSMSSNRTWHTATRLPDGRVLVIGGYDSSGNTMSSTIVYNPTGSGSFTNGPTLDTPRKQHTATLLTSGSNAGKVLVVGGRKKSGSGYVTLATYQICGASAPMGPITCTSSATGIAGRYAHAAVALGPTGSKVLIVGGTNGSAALASAELYDSATGTWAASGTLGVLSPARSELTLSELPNGRALAVGGSFNGMAKKDADAYTPPIAAMADMWTPRAGHTATALRDAAGNITGILVTGGADDDADEDDALDSAEIYGTQ